MATTSLYKGLTVITPRQAGGQLIINDFKEMADRAGPVHQEGGQPDPLDDSNGTGGNGSFYQWSKWYNTSDESIWICVDDTVSSAVWKKVMDTANINMGDLGDVNSAAATTSDILAWDITSWSPTSAANSAMSASSASAANVATYVYLNGPAQSQTSSPSSNYLMVGDGSGFWKPFSRAPLAQSAESAYSATLAGSASEAAFLTGAQTNSSGWVMVYYSSSGQPSSWAARSIVPSADVAQFLIGTTNPSHGSRISYSSGATSQGWTVF